MIEHRDEGAALSERTRALEERLERALAELAEEKRLAAAYRAVFHDSPDAMAITDARGEILDVNEGSLRLLGYQRQELIGRKWWRQSRIRTTSRWSAPSSAPWLAASVTTSISKNVTAAKTGPGSRARMRSGVARDAAGGVIAIDATMKNAEDDLRAATSVRAVDARNRALLDAVPDLLFIMSPDGRFLDCKPSRDVPLLLPPSAFLGRRTTDVLPPEVGQTHADKSARWPRPARTRSTITRSTYTREPAISRPSSRARARARSCSPFET